MTRQLSAYLALTVFGAGVLSGCDLLTGSNGERVMGIIGWEYASTEATAGFVIDEEPCLGPEDAEPLCHLQAPDTVDAGEPFEVLVQTASGSSGSAIDCWRPDGADVSASPTIIEIVPYDLRIPYTPGGRGCLDLPRWLPRTLELVFPEPGDALLRLTGRVVIRTKGEEGEELAPWDERLGSIDHPVVVR
jgi:hypothetical protein